MAVYRLDGTAQSAAYNVKGASIAQAYDIEGNELLQTVPSYLKVMNYNVGQWYIGDGTAVPTAKKEAYYTLQTETFARNRPDILCVQEYYAPWCRDGSLPSELLEPYFDDIQTTNPAKQYIGHAICSNGYPLLNYTNHSFTVHLNNYPNYQTAQIVVDGKTINIINTHNDYHAENQPSQIADLLRAVEGMEYFILMGDFNTNIYYPGDFENTETEQYITNIKPFLDAGYHVANCNYEWLETYYGNTASTYAARDNIITSPNISFVSVSVDTAKLTDDLGDKVDHIPLIAELRID